MHYEVLDSKRQALLPALEAFKDTFYLAGGTALALQIGHRVSIDFDFFTPDQFDTRTLFDQVRAVFGEVPRTQEADHTLAVVVESDVRVSFMGYAYPLVEPIVKTEHLRLASIADIGTMKLNAIVSRAELKDYVDLFFILKHIPLTNLLVHLANKIPTLDQNLALKALVSFDDLTQDPIDFISGHTVSAVELQTAIKAAVKAVPLGIR